MTNATLSKIEQLANLLVPHKPHKIVSQFANDIEWRQFKNAFTAYCILADAKPDTSSGDTALMLFMRYLSPTLREAIVKDSVAYRECDLFMFSDLC